MNRKRRLYQKRGGLVAGFFLLAGIAVLRLPELWLVRAQLRAAVGGRLTGWVDDQSTSGRQKERTIEARLAARTPDDFLVQMAVALRNMPPDNANFPPSNHSLPLDAVSGQEARVGSAAAFRLRELTGRFNNRPELHAAILRNMARNEVGLSNRRSEQNALSADDQALFSTAPNLNTPRALSDWDAACAQGERLDPENAYFPAMRAFGFYARHEDDRATAALERAGNAPSYNDYAGVETVAQWRLLALKVGDGRSVEPGAIPRLGEYAGLCYWHYSALRQLARVATAKAMQAEQRGDAEGFRIRHAVARLGAIMRASPNGGFISPRVGITITETATLRPGGASTIIESDEAKRREKRQAAYKAFLLRTGHADEAQFIEWENDARAQIDAIYRDAQNLPGNENNLGSFGQLCAAWAVGIGLLTNAFVVTLAGGLAALYRRFAPRFAPYKNGSPRGKGVWIAFQGVGFLLIGAGLFALGRYGGALAASGFGFGLMDTLSGFHNEASLFCIMFAIGAASVGGAIAPLIVVFACKTNPELAIIPISSDSSTDRCFCMAQSAQTHRGLCGYRAGFDPLRAAGRAWIACALCGRRVVDDGQGSRLYLPITACRTGGRVVFSGTIKQAVARRIPPKRTKRNEPVKNQSTRKAKSMLISGVAALTFGGLLLTPASGWLVRAQLRSAVGQSPNVNYSLPSSAQEEQAQRAVRIAADPVNRNDVGLQMAARERVGFAAFSEERRANAVTGANWRVDGLRPLLNDPALGSRPELWATVLRYMTQESVRLDDRIETQLLTEPKPRPASQIADVQTKPNPNRNTPVALLEWDNACREGARLDPGNAYFSILRAVGLFAARKDDEAVAAFIEASRKGHYNDYAAEETEGALRLNAQMNGKTGYLSDLAISAAASYPNYSQIRSASQLAVLYAMRRELAGQAEEGFAIRQAVLRAGALMRVGSTSLSGGWTGDRLVRWTPARPGGALPLPKIPDEPYAVRTQKNRARFSVYLTRIGHEDAGKEFRYEIEAGDKHRAFWGRAENDPNNVLQLAPAYRLINCWALGVGVLTNLIVLLVLGGVCAFAARSRRIREGLPLSPAARSGAASALAVPVIGLGIALTWPELPAQILTALVSAGLATLLFRAFRHAARAKQATPETAQPVGKSFALPAFCLSMGVTLLGLLALGVLSQTGAPQLLRSAGELMGLRAEEANPLKIFANGLLGVGAASGVSLLLILGLTIVSRARRVPVSVGVVRGFRRLALPVASLLVFVYAGVVLQTLREEARATAALQTCLRDGEAAYLAGLLHETPPVLYRNLPAK